MLIFVFHIITQRITAIIHCGIEYQKCYILPDMSRLTLGHCTPKGIVRTYQAMHPSMCTKYYMKLVYIVTKSLVRLSINTYVAVVHQSFTIEPFHCNTI